MEEFSREFDKSKDDMTENNQYPPSFYKPIIKRTLNKIIDSNSEQQDVEKEDQKEAKLIFVQCTGRITERFEQSLKRRMAPCKVCVYFAQGEVSTFIVENTVGKSS